MSNRVQTQSGSSLADIYNTKGSKLDIDEIDVREIKGVHEMGATIFSERLSGGIRRGSTGAIAENIVFGEVMNMATVPSRLLALVVFTDNAARIDDCNVVILSTESDGDLQECPLWIWDGANSEIARFIDNAGNADEHNVLLPTPGTRSLPSMSFGTDQPTIADRLVLRGTTTGFGAGTVTLTMLAYVANALARTGEISSRGLAIPGW